MLPADSPDRLRDRETLWNEVEATEKRKDAQLAREVEFAIPREMTKEQGIALARDFVEREFVARAMVADLNVHWDIGADGEAKPHAHVMLTLREIDGEGFGPKVREWNATALLQHWRTAWADHVNARCATLGIDARIDHRSYEHQGIDLEPQHKIGAAGARREAKGEEAERADDHRAIARSNGAVILAKPEVGLEALTRTQATFTVRDLAMFVHRHSDGKEQFDAVLAAMRASDSILALGRDGRGQERFTTTSMLSAEDALARHAATLAANAHAVGKADVERAIASAERRGLKLGAEQRGALDHVVKRPGLSLVVGFAGSGKSAMLGVAREAWEAAGFIGGREVERDDVSRSRTQGRFTTRSMSMQTRRSVEDVALASEITQLSNREGFLKRATNSDWRRVRFPYKCRNDRILRFDPRPISLGRD
jgi:ATP-dependent exoDNAse (exonuclease V) alpha subunit